MLISAYYPSLMLTFYSLYLCINLSEDNLCIWIIKMSFYMFHIMSNKESWKSNAVVSEAWLTVSGVLQGAHRLTDTIASSSGS